MNEMLKETMDELESIVVTVALKKFNESVENTQRMADLYQSVGFIPKPGKNSVFLDHEACDRIRLWIRGETPDAEFDLEEAYADIYLDRAKAIMIPILEG